MAFATENLISIILRMEERVDQQSKQMEALTAELTAARAQSNLSIEALSDLMKSALKQIQKEQHNQRRDAKSTSKMIAGMCVQMDAIRNLLNEAARSRKRRRDFEEDGGGPKSSTSLSRKRINSSHGKTGKSKTEPSANTRANATTDSRSKDISANVAGDFDLFY